MPDSEFRANAAACALLALDKSRTLAQRAQSQLQQTLWLKMASEAVENDDARRILLAMRPVR